MRQSIDFCDSCGRVFADSSGKARRYGMAYVDVTSADHQRTVRMRWDVCAACSAKARKAIIKALGKGVGKPIS